MTDIGGSGLGLRNEGDGFFYDLLEIPDGKHPLRVRSMVGLIPLMAVGVLDRSVFERSKAHTGLTADLLRPTSGDGR